MHDQFVKINKTHKSPKAIDKDTQYILACCEMILEFQNNFPLKNDSTEIWQLNVQRKPLELFLTLPHVHLVLWNSAVTQTCTMKLFKTKSAIFIPLTILMSDRVLFTKSTVVNMYQLTATSIPVDTKPSVEFHTLHARRYIYIWCYVSIHRAKSRAVYKQWISLQSGSLSLDNTCMEVKIISSHY